MIISTVLLGGKGSLSRCDFHHWYLYTRCGIRRVELVKDTVVKHLFTGATLITYDTGKLTWDIKQGALLENFILVVSDEPLSEGTFFHVHRRGQINENNKVHLDAMSLQTSIPIERISTTRTHPLPGIPDMDVTEYRFPDTIKSLMKMVPGGMPLNFHPTVDGWFSGGLILTLKFTDWEAFEFTKEDFSDRLFTSNDTCTFEIDTPWVGKANYYYRLMGNNHHGLLIDGQQIDLHAIKLSPDTNYHDYNDVLSNTQCGDHLVSIMCNETLGVIEIINPSNIGVQLLVTPKMIDVRRFYHQLSIQIPDVVDYRYFVDNNHFTDGKSISRLPIYSVDDDVLRDLFHKYLSGAIKYSALPTTIGYITKFVLGLDNVVHYELEWLDKNFYKFDGLMAINHSVYPVFEFVAGVNRIVGFNYQPSNPRIETRKLIEKFEFKFGV